MKLFGVFVALAAAVLLGPSAAVAAPLSAYGKLPTIEAVAVSPSGHALAIVATDGEQRTIVINDLATGATTLRAFLGDHKIRRVQWAGDRHLLIVYSATLTVADWTFSRGEWYFGSIIDLTSKKLRPLLGDSKADVSAIFDMPIVRSYRGEPAVFVQGLDGNMISLFRVDLDSANTHLLQKGVPDTVDWVVDSEGRALGQALYDDVTGAWSLRLHYGGVWREVATAKERIDVPYLVGLGRDNASVIYAARDKDGGWSWREVRNDGAPAAEPRPTLDSQNPISAALDGRLIGEYALVGDEGRYTFFDATDTKVWKAVTAAYPGDRVELESWSADRTRIAVRVDSPTSGPAYAIVDLATQKANWIGAEYFGLRTPDIAIKEPVRFKAQDGLELTGYLTRPSGSLAKNLPLIVFPHGGPAARDEPGFDWWAQAMASRGYAVLQVNFRGSAGLGEALLEAGYDQWGRKMQTDLSDGVRYLAAQGVIDPKRVCIVGASYGGYAALAGATLDHGVYRCAVSVAGVADLPRQVAYSKTHGGLVPKRYWNRFIGTENMADYSPAAQASKADIPILLIHGDDDTVVPIEQSRIMFNALQKAGKPAELVVQKGADHSLARGETRLKTLEAAMAFVEKHNPPN